MPNLCVALSCEPVLRWIENPFIWRVSRPFRTRTHEYPCCGCDVYEYRECVHILITIKVSSGLYIYMLSMLMKLGYLFGLLGHKGRYAYAIKGTYTAPRAAIALVGNHI